MLTEGARLAHYRIEALLGEGGMGQVYRAFDETLHRRVALKILFVADTLAAQRMVREARAAAALEHPNKVSIYELGEVDGTPYLAMELIDGVTLSSMVGDRTIAWQNLAAWLLDVARALEAAHAAGLVHRDIKPDNVMLRSDGVVKVLDFGIARRSAAILEGSGPPGASGLPSVTGGTIAGTAAYMAPEQVRGDALDGRCDQFAWGVTAFEMLSGEHPWGRAEPLALLSRMLTSRPRTLADLRPDLPLKLSDILARTLASEPSDRFPSMQSIVSEFAPFLGQRERVMPPTHLREQRASGSRRSDDFASARTEQVSDNNAIASARTEVAMEKHGVVPGPQELASARSAILSSSTRLSDAHDGSGKSPAKSRLIRLGGWLVALLAVGAIALQMSRSSSSSATVSSRSASSVSSSFSAPSASSASGAVAIEAHLPVFPCDKTKKEFPSNIVRAPCSEAAEAWCSPTGRIVACCAKGLVPEGEEGICGCPPASSGEASERAAACPPSTVAAMSGEEIQQIVRERFPQIRSCYEAALKRLPTMTGRVAIYFEIDPVGEVFFARVQEGTLPDADAQKCTLAVFRNLHFRPPQGGVANVVYPISFAPGN